MTTQSLLPMAMPAVSKVAVSAAAETVCTVCGSPDWIACAPGEASTADLYARSNIVALRADDGVPAQAWCVAHWVEAFPAVRVAERDLQGDAR